MKTFLNINVCNVHMNNNVQLGQFLVLCRLLYLKFLPMSYRFSTNCSKQTNGRTDGKVNDGVCGVSGDSKIPMSTLSTSYVAATGGALGTALGEALRAVPV